MMEITKVRNIETVTGEIKALQNKTLACAIEIGRRLCEAKELLPHGEWGEWLKNEVDFSQSTANNLMRLFDEYGSSQSALFDTETNSQTFANISYSNALRLLSLPEDERETFTKENDVENMSARELDRLIKEKDEALKAKAAAEKRTADAEQERANALVAMQENASEQNKKFEEKEREVKKLSDLLAELKSKPIEVAVTQADPAEMEAAIAKAKAEASAEREKEITELEKQIKTAAKEKASIMDARAETESKMKQALEDLEAEKIKTEEAEQKLEAFRKSQVMSDPVVTEFKTLFTEVQRLMSRLKVLAQGAGENKDKLDAALAAMIDAYKVGGEAEA